jgi:hypothetical protein
MAGRSMSSFETFRRVAFVAAALAAACSAGGDEGGGGEGSFDDPPGSDPGFESPPPKPEAWKAHDWPLSEDGPAASTVKPVQLAAGGHHACARMEDGTVRCWGDDSSGQLGGSSIATPVIGISDAIDIVAGDYHTCVRVKDGTMRCWGENSQGQLGDGTTVRPPGPVTVPLENVSSMTATSRGGTCAVSEGKVYCWGGQNVDRLGFGFLASKMPDGYNKAAPGIPIIDVTTALQVGLSDRFGCALLDGGSVRCWGAGLEGLSNKTTNITDAVTLESGVTSQCALTRAGSIQCWSGDAYSFAVATIPEEPNYAVAEVVPASAGKIRQFALNRLQTTPGGNDGAFLCAVFEDGTLGCMGDNVFGQLGVESTSACTRRGTSRCPFNKVPGLSGVTQVTAGGAFTCVLHEDSSVRCWGYDKEDNLGGSSIDTPIAW